MVLVTRPGMAEAALVAVWMREQMTLGAAASSAYCVDTDQHPMRLQFLNKDFVFPEQVKPAAPTPIEATWGALFCRVLEVRHGCCIER